MTTSFKDPALARSALEPAADGSARKRPDEEIPRVGVLSRVWAVTVKDATQESRRKIAVASVLFFAATSLTLVSYAIGPLGLPPDVREGVSSAVLWIILFFAAATGLPRSYILEEETGTALALRRAISPTVVLAGKTLFNFGLFLAIAAVVVPGLMILLEWTVASWIALAGIILLAGFGLAVVSTFLSAVVARASQKSVLFVVLSFPVLVPLLLSAIAATLEASRGSLASTAIQVLVGYDGAAACGAYLLIGAAWED
jgi:heme exporter protein B